MSPFTHLLASWIVAAKTTDNLRDRRLVALAGILPDADGLGLVVDMVKDPSLQRGAFYYQEYHHWVAHGIAGGIAIAILMACFARCRWRVLLLALFVFHLHLLCDLLGSRGESLNDIWPIYYYGPFSRVPMWLWKYQWQLDGWQNRVSEFVFFVWAMWLTIKQGDSFIGVFNRRVDGVFVAVIQKWWGQLNAIRKGTPLTEKN